MIATSHEESRDERHLFITYISIAQGMTQRYPDQQIYDGDTIIIFLVLQCFSLNHLNNRSFPPSSRRFIFFNWQQRNLYPKMCWGGTTDCLWFQIGSLLLIWDCLWILPTACHNINTSLRGSRRCHPCGQGNN